MRLATTLFNSTYVQQKHTGPLSQASQKHDDAIATVVQQLPTLITSSRLNNIQGTD